MNRILSYTLIALGALVLVFAARACVVAPAEDPTASVA